MDKSNLRSAFSQIHDHRPPHVAGELNGRLDQHQKSLRSCGGASPRSEEEIVRYGDTARQIKEILPLLARSRWSGLVRFRILRLFHFIVHLPALWTRSTSVTNSPSSTSTGSRTLRANSMVS